MTIDWGRFRLAVAYFATWLLAIGVAIAAYHSRWLAGLLGAASLGCLACLAWLLAGERSRKPPP